MMAQLRRWHGYLGIFIAPAIIFFALSGALQLLSLHELHGTYRSPVIIQQLASLHKDQQFEQEQPGDDKAQLSQDAWSTSPHSSASDIATAALKWFFLLISLGLASSTSLGLWIGLRQSRRKLLSYALLAAGIILPAADIIVLIASTSRPLTASTSAHSITPH